MFERGNEEISAIAKVFESGAFMRYRGGEGGFTEQFEAKVCERTGSKYALCMNSGTNALISAMVGLKLKHGDEVIVPAYTWVASAMAALMAGAIPVLADVDESLCLDPEDFERRITPNTKAVIPVHINNRLCNLDAICAIAKKHNIYVVEDACQAVGLRYADGRSAGAIGDAGAFSFNVFKNIMCGEGGMLLTDSRTVYERALMLHDAGCYTRNHADSISEPFFPGFNFRVSEVQGAILFEQYKRLERIIGRLNEHKAIALKELAGAKSFRIAKENDPGTLSVVAAFECPDMAKQFAEKFGLLRIADSGRHIFTNWEPILKKTFYSDEVNPYRFAKGEISYAKEKFQRTLDIVDRSVLIDYGYDKSADEYRAFCRQLAAF